MARNLLLKQSPVTGHCSGQTDIICWRSKDQSCADNWIYSNCGDQRFHKLHNNVCYYQVT